SCLPKEAEKYCDSVVIGEGELHWLDVIKDCEDGCLKSSYGSLDESFDLNNSPLPAFELLDISKYNRLTVQTSRGCPHRCEFCASSVILSAHYKQKPIEKVLKEIDKILEIWKHPFIEFADDNSIVDKAYWKELLSYLKDKKIRWFTETDISVSEDDDLLDLMRDAGCAQLLIGFESPISSGLDGLEMHTNWKLKRLPKYKQAIKKIQSHGITVNGCFIIGLDGHTSDIFEHVFNFAKEAQLYEVQITILTAFPGTPLYNRLKQEGRIIKDEDWKKCTLFDINYQPKNMSVEMLAKGFRDLGVKLYSEEFTNWRRDNFKENLRKDIQKKKGGKK
ncbi:MAG: radical SAM protein, partial [Alphaproteobacteria bacterium]